MDPLLQWIGDALRAITEAAAPAPTKFETPNGVTIGVVREGDVFDYEIGAEAKVNHVSAGKAGDRRVVAAYGLLVTPAGKRHLEVRTVTKTGKDWLEDMEALRRRKPRPLAKAFGKQGPTPEQAEQHRAAMTAWNTAYSRVRKAWNAAAEAERRAYEARQQP